MDESTLKIVGLIIIASAILQIMLFFKIWGMTNDVRKMKRKLSPSDNIWSVQRLLLMGQKDKAKDALIECMLCDIESYMVEKLSKHNSIDEIKNKYTPLFEKLGAEIPEGIKNVHSQADIKALLPELKIAED